MSNETAAEKTRRHAMARLLADINRAYREAAHTSDLSPYYANLQRQIKTLEARKTEMITAHRDAILAEGDDR